MPPLQFLRNNGAGDCDVTFSGRLGAGNPDDYKADNLIVIGAGTTVNLTLASTAFFKPYDGYALIAGQEGEVLEVKGSTFINADKAFYQLRATLKP